MEIFFIGALFGALIGWGVPATKVNVACEQGQKQVCEVQKKINPKY